MERVAPERTAEAELAGERLPVELRVRLQGLGFGGGVTEAHLTLALEGVTCSLSIGSNWAMFTWKFLHSEHRTGSRGDK